MLFLDPDGAGTSGALVFLTVGPRQHVADCRIPIDDLSEVISGKYSEALRSDIALAHGTIMCATFASRPRSLSLHVAVHGADIALFPLWIAYGIEPILERAGHELLNIHDTVPYSRLIVARRRAGEVGGRKWNPGRTARRKAAAVGLPDRANRPGSAAWTAAHAGANARLNSKNK